MAHVGNTTKITQKKKLGGRVFRRFGVKEPRHSENISDENCYLYRIMRLAKMVDGDSRKAGPIPPVPRVKHALQCRFGIVGGSR